MNVYRRFLSILRHRGEELILYEIVIRSIGIPVGVFVALAARNIIEIKVQALAGAQGLWSLANIPSVVLFIVAFFTFLYVSIIEIIGLCHIAHSYGRAEKVTLVAALRFSSKRALGVFRTHGLSVIFALFLGIILFPFMGVSPSLFKVFDLPISLIEESYHIVIHDHVYTALILLAVYLSFRFIFVFNIFASKPYTLLRSARESWRLTRIHGKLHHILTWGMVFPVIICIGLFISTAILCFTLIGLINSFFGLVFAVLPATLSVMLYASWIYILTAIISVAIAPVIISTITAYLEVRIPKAQGNISSKPLEEISENEQGWKIIHHKKTVFIIGLCAFMLFAYIAKSYIYIFRGFNQVPLVISHRGNGVEENSIQSMSHALLKGADGVETDIQRLASGELVMYHDESLSRLHGIDKNIRDVSLQELNLLNIHITKFDDVIPLMKQSKQQSTCHWLLEVKAYPGYEQSISIMEEIYRDLVIHKLQSCAYIGSFDLEALTYIEQKNPDIKTVAYLLGKPAPEIDLNIFDAINVEQSEVAKSFVREVQRSDKHVFVWTVNDDRSVSALVALGVTGIVTDNLQSIKQSVESYRNVFKNSPDEKVVSIFGKTYLIDPASLWQFKLKYSIF